MINAFSCFFLDHCFASDSPPASVLTPMSKFKKEVNNGTLPFKWKSETIQSFRI